MRSFTYKYKVINIDNIGGVGGIEKLFTLNCGSVDNSWEFVGFCNTRVDTYNIEYAHLNKLNIAVFRTTNHALEFEMV